MRLRLRACGLGRRRQEGVGCAGRDADEQQAAARDWLGLEGAGGALGGAAPEGARPGAQPLPRALEDGGTKGPGEQNWDERKQRPEQGEPEHVSDLGLGLGAQAQGLEHGAEAEAGETTADVRVPVDFEVRVHEDLAGDPHDEWLPVRAEGAVGGGGCGGGRGEGLLVKGGRDGARASSALSVSVSASVAIWRPQMAPLAPTVYV